MVALTNLEKIPSEIRFLTETGLNHALQKGNEFPETDENNLSPSLQQSIDSNVNEFWSLVEGHFSKSMSVSYLC